MIHTPRTPAGEESMIALMLSSQEAREYQVKNLAGLPHGTGAAYRGEDAFKMYAIPAISSAWKPMATVLCKVKQARYGFEQMPQWSNQEAPGR